jgi:PGF-pre-PGF domain-containing protein
MSGMSRVKNKARTGWKTMALGLLVIMIVINYGAKEVHANSAMSVDYSGQVYKVTGETVDGIPRYVVDIQKDLDTTGPVYGKYYESNVTIFDYEVRGASNRVIWVYNSSNCGNDCRHFPEFSKAVPILIESGPGRIHVKYENKTSTIYPGTAGCSGTPPSETVCWNWTADFYLYPRYYIAKFLIWGNFSYIYGPYTGDNFNIPFMVTTNFNSTASYLSNGTYYGGNSSSHIYTDINNSLAFIYNESGHNKTYALFTLSGGHNWTNPMRWSLYTSGITSHLGLGRPTSGNFAAKSGWWTYGMMFAESGAKTLAQNYSVWLGFREQYYGLYYPATATAITGMYEGRYDVTSTYNLTAASGNILNFNFSLGSYNRSYPVFHIRNLSNITLVKDYVYFRNYSSSAPRWEKWTNWTDFLIQEGNSSYFGYDYILLTPNYTFDTTGDDVYEFYISNSSVPNITGCADLGTSGETYYLTQDITDSSATVCMNVIAANVTLDCQGHTIDGTDASNTYGVYGVGTGAMNSTIKNCVISDFRSGIVFDQSSNNILINNTVNSNTLNGIYLSSSSNNVLTNNTLNSNLRGVILDSSSNNILINSTIQATHSASTQQQGLMIIGSSLSYLRHNINESNTINGLPILYMDGAARPCADNTIYSNGSSYSYMGFVGCNNMTIENSNPSDHIMLIYTNNSEIRNSNVSFSFIGISVNQGSNNTLINNTATNNYRGIYLSSTSNTSLSNNTARDNTYNILLFSASNTVATGGSIADSSSDDYYLSSIGATTTNFTNTNFTGQRSVYFADISSWFNYNNETDGNIWLKTNVSDSGRTITRKLTYWSRLFMKWNDTSSASTTARYNITGLLPDTYYDVYNDSVLVQILETDSDGVLPTFTIGHDTNEHEIRVQESEPPKYFDSASNNTVAGQPTLFSLNWTDNVGLHGYVFSTNNTGTWTNDTWSSFPQKTFGRPPEGGIAGGAFNLNDNVVGSDYPITENGVGKSVTAWLNNCLGDKIKFALYDKSNNETVAVTYETIGTTNDHGWVTANFTAEPILEAGKNYHIVAWSDGSCNFWNDGNAPWHETDVEEGSYIYDGFPSTWSYNYSHGGSAMVFCNYTPTVSWSNITKTLNSTVGQKVGWRVYANDTYGNWNASEVFTLATTDGEPPKYFDSASNNTVAGQPTLFSLNWTDNVGLHGYVFSTDNLGTWQNDTFATFNTSSVGVSAIGNSSTGGAANFEYCWNGTELELEGDGIVRTMSIYMTHIGTQKFKAAIYSDTGSGGPDECVAYCSGTQHDASSEGWKNFTVNTMLSAGKYWICLQREHTTLSDEVNYTESPTSEYRWGDFACPWANFPCSGGAFIWSANYKMSGFFTVDYSKTEDWSNVTKTLNSTVGQQVGWRVYANDTYGNWNASEVFSLTTTTDYMPPTTTTTTTIPYGLMDTTIKSQEKVKKIFHSIIPGIPKTIDPNELDHTNTDITNIYINVNTRATKVNISAQRRYTAPNMSFVPGIVYKFIDISAENLPDESLEEVVIKFKVNKTWLNDNYVDSSYIALYRYENETWSELNTVMTGEDDGYKYYESSTPGFSYFAIISQPDTAGVTTTTSPPPTPATTTTSTQPPATTSTSVPTTARQPSSLEIMEMVIIVVIAIVSLVIVSDRFNSLYKN